jgi:hypothetical protein
MRLILLWLAACSNDERDFGSASGGGISDDDAATTAEEAGDDDADEDSSNGEDGGIRLDVGAGSAEGVGDDGASDTGCKRVDFLFVIDSSISMGSNQSDLVAAFPDFVQTITTTLVGVDSYHVGVVTSDAYDENEAGCTEIGALVTQTGGPDASGGTCGPFAEGRYMSDADDLATAFACAAQVGTGGDNDEKMMEATLGAISAELNAPGACNAGFMRDDALLVMVLITDEDDPGSCGIPGIGCAGSPGDPPSWHTQVIERKVHPENVVALSLTRGAPGNVCGSPGLGEIDAVRIMAFASLFGSNGFTGDICAPFGPFFEEAVSVIDTACDDFIPPG